MDLDVRTADESTLRRLDGLVLFWLVLWLVVGAWAGYNVWQVSEVGDTLTSSGRAISSTGDALESVGSVPVVGERTGELGVEIGQTGEEVAARGQEVESELRQLAILLGLAIVLLPAAPVMWLYLPLRNARRRELAEVRELLGSSTDGDVADRYLAQRALQRLPLATLQRVEPDPWQAVADGRTRPLADAELQRLGLHRRRG